MLGLSKNNVTTLTEVARAVNKLKNGKAAGTDHIQPELLKHAETIIPHLTKLFNTVWQSKEVHRVEEWYDRATSQER